MNNTKPNSQPQLFGVAETDQRRQQVVLSLANHAEVKTSDWRIQESSILSEILYLEEAYGFDLDSFLESRWFSETEYVKTALEVEDFLSSFVAFGYQWPIDDIDFPNQQDKFVPRAIEDWEAMLEFALKGNKEPKVQLCEAIRETFPLAFQQPLVADAEWSLEILSDYVGEELMLEALKRTSSQGFAFFLTMETLSLRDIDDIYCLVDDLVEDYDGNRLDNEVIVQRIVDCIKTTDGKTIREISRFLSLDKDSMINKFIIPYYKVSKASHIWLDDRTDIAFSKGTKKAFGFEIANSITVLNRFFELETSDFVSIFEYILEEQDRVLEAEKTTMEK